MKEWYDFDSKLARIDYQPLGSQDDMITGKHKISEIHDFNGGFYFIYIF